MRYQLLMRTIMVAVLITVGAAEAAEMTLQQVTFPERQQIEIAFARSARSPVAEFVADVAYREGQANIKIRFREMKPAILLGGDVTSYVLWAVTGDGTTENLGELWVRKESDTLEYSTGLKSFAMLVTAESHSLVSSPSELVIFWSEATSAKKASNDAITFSAFAPAPRTEYSSVAEIIWDKRQSLDLRQAEKAYELAVDADAEKYASSELRRAFTALTQARNYNAQKKDKAAVDYSRRSLALSAEAQQLTERRKEAEAIEAEIARRTAEMEALTARASEAESTAKAAAVALTEAQRQQQEADAAIASAQTELNRIQAERLELQGSVTALQEQASSLAREKEDLSSRLEGALSLVADTQTTARGMIVSLPDILFDTNEATLKSDAKVVIAKLAGILLILPQLNLRVEGHTDSTGGADYNQELSERRAASVREFLGQQGIASERMVSIGYGMDRPIGDNSTREGRAKNRRVEIVIAEGEIAE